ncbi:hypothetical protein L195_g063365, partial [Trifolium pratense]
FPFLPGESLPSRCGGVRSLFQGVTSTLSRSGRRCLTAAGWGGEGVAWCLRGGELVFLRRRFLSSAAILSLCSSSRRP